MIEVRLSYDRVGRLLFHSDDPYVTVQRVHAGVVTSAWRVNASELDQVVGRPVEADETLTPDEESNVASWIDAWETGRPENDPLVVTLSVKRGGQLDRRWLVVVHPNGQNEWRWVHEMVDAAENVYGR